MISRLRWSGWVAWGVLAAGLSSGCAGRALSGPRGEMIAILGAATPHPSIQAEATVFDRLVGTWDTRFSFIAEDGTITHPTGELRFGWIMDGRALQDLWISYPKDGKGERTIGTTIRYFDHAAKIWRVVFFAPAFGAMINMSGGAEGNRIVLRGTDGAGLALRWTFNDIQADSFVWRGEVSSDGGRTWRLGEEHQMTRRKG